MKLLQLAITLLISTAAFSQTPEQRLAELKISLPEVPPAIGSYVDARKAGNLIYLVG